MTPRDTSAILGAMRWLLVLLTIATLVPTRALAQTDGGTASAPVADTAGPPPPPPQSEQDAQAHFFAGRAHYDRGNYEAALTEFQTAYELSPRPAMAFNLYLAHERLGHFTEAAAHLLEFLENADPSEIDDRAVLEARLANLRQRAAAAQAQQAAPPPQPARTAPPPEQAGVSPIAIAGFAAAGVGAVTFGIFAALSASEDGDLAGRCGSDVGAFCTDDDVSSLRTFNTVADIGLVVGVLGAGVGTIFLLAGGGDDDEVAFAPYVSPYGMGAAASGSF